MGHSTDHDFLFFFFFSFFGLGPGLGEMILRGVYVMR